MPVFKRYAVPPPEVEKISLKSMKSYAAGWPAVYHSLEHAVGQMSLGNCVKTLFSINQMGGFDCPGCAWPDPDDHRSKIGEYCENGVKAIAEEATEARVTPAFFSKYSLSEMSEWTDYKIGKSGRITHPMYLPPGSDHYCEISWNEAYSIIGKHLKSLSSPDEATFYTSGRTSNEAAFLYQLFVRMYGTNNLPDCSNMCHESSGVALNYTTGIGKGSVTLEDFYITDLIVIVGQNPGTNHPRMLSALQKAKKNGAKIISINPLPEAGLTAFKNPQHVADLLGSATSLCDLFLQVKVNSDVALFKAILIQLLKKEQNNPRSIVDQDFITASTDGYEEFKKDLEAYNYLEQLDLCGITHNQVMEAVELIAARPKMIACWAMGLTQHKNAVDNIQELVNLLLIRGAIGKPGAGTCPVRGHSNVQGDRTMGIYEKPSQGFLDSLAKVFHFTPPQVHGFDTIESIEAMHSGKVKVFIGMGGNFLSATPDTEFTAEALQNCNLTVQISTKLNRSHIIAGKEALILPALGRTEIDIQEAGPQFVSVENSMGIVSSSRGRIEPASQYCMSEPAIVAHLANEVIGTEKGIDWLNLIKDYDKIRELIEASIPGFQDYNKRVRNDGGFYLPNGAREGQYKTTTGKARFTINKNSTIKVKDDEFILMTIRTHDQFNTTIYGMDDRYRGILNARRVVLINGQDIQKLGMQEGDWVDIVQKDDQKTRVASYFKLVAYSIPQGSLGAYFPETNVLVPINSFADKSQTPTSKSIVVKLKPTSFQIQAKK